MRLFKAANPAGTVRGFSDAPSAFASDFNKSEKVLKALHVRRLYLWPRFQAAVKADLEAHPPEVRTRQGGGVLGGSDGVQGGSSD